MKNVTKTNILFTFMAAFYLVVIFSVRLLPFSVIGANVRLILPEVVMLIPAFLYVRLLKPEGMGELRLECPPPVNIVRIMIITVSLIPFISLVNSLSTLFTENRASAVMGNLTGNPLWLNILLMAFIPAICEEYIFRGLIFYGYYRRNPWGAMLMSSFLFGIIHMNINQFIYAFLMGLILCMLVYATGTVVSSMTAHFVFNGFNVVIAHLNADMADRDTLRELQAGDYAVIYAVMTALAVLGLYAAYRVFRRLCEANRGFANVSRILKKENRRRYQEEEGKFFDGYSIVGISLCVLYMTAYGL